MLVSKILKYGKVNLNVNYLVYYGKYNLVGKLLWKIIIQFIMENYKPAKNFNIWL